MKVAVFMLITILMPISVLFAKAVKVEDYQYSITLSDLSPMQAEKEATRRAIDEILIKEAGINVVGFVSSSAYEDGFGSYDKLSSYISTISSGFVTNYKINEIKRDISECGTAIKIDLNLTVTLNIPDNPNPHGLRARLNKLEYKHKEIAKISCSFSKAAYLSVIAIADDDIVYLLWSSSGKEEANVNLIIPPTLDPLNIIMVRSYDRIEYGSLCLIASPEPLFKHVSPPQTIPVSDLSRIIDLRKHSIVYMPYSIN
jgi:hypothetical protein